MNEVYKRGVPVLLLFFLVYGCEEKARVIEPISPILKEVKMPNKTSILPGEKVRIDGLGFDESDKLILADSDGKRYETEVTNVTDDFIEFIIPSELAGEYSVTISRSGKETTLPGRIEVPFIVPLTDIKLPDAPIEAGEDVSIDGEGFETGDIIKFLAPFYPSGSDYSVSITATSEGANFSVPFGVYGVNSLLVIRGDRQTNIGEITIAVNVGDELGGGIVYWVNDNKMHGLIAAKQPAGTPTEQFGPEVSPSQMAGTNQDIGTGKQNTVNIVAKMVSLMDQFNWPEWIDVKIAAQVCDELSITDNSLTYNDWFLPSREELKELFRKKNILADKGFPIPPNNYWTSSEADGGNGGWAAFYVNFYEAVNIVSDIASKSGWKLGVYPVRTY